MITKDMVNAAYGKAKELRMTGTPSDFRQVLEAVAPVAVSVPEAWELEAAAIFMDHVDDDETGSVHRVAAFLREVSGLSSIIPATERPFYIITPSGEAHRNFTIVYEDASIIPATKVVVTEKMILLACMAFDDGIGDPNDGKRRMGKALLAALAQDTDGVAR